MDDELAWPGNQAEAIDFLNTLKLKDTDTRVCRYPTCQRPRQEATGTGRKPAYCDNAHHTSMTNHTARVQLRLLATGGKSETAPKSTFQGRWGSGGVESLRTSVLTHISQLQMSLEQYVSTLTEIADPDIASAQIQSAQDRANARISEVQELLQVERALRQVADAAQKAAQEEAASERDAAEQAIQSMQEAEQRIVVIEADRDATVERLRNEMQRYTQRVEEQAKESIESAKAAMEEALEEARLARLRVHDVEVAAQAQITTSERLVAEAHALLDRERMQADQLRNELRVVLAETRQRADEDRKRAESDRAQAQTLLDQERGEADRLRAELATLRSQIEQGTKRADHLASVNDDLRDQLVRLQLPKKGKPQQQ